MRIAFVDVANWEYTIETAYRAPLGGSQSAMCYLAEQLAALGHEVYLLNRHREISVSRGVFCVPVDKISAEVLRTLDAAIIQNTTQPAKELRALLSPRTPLILWTQHAHDQPAISGLADPEVRKQFDAVAFVSQWQRDEYVRQFGIDVEKTEVLRNAPSPAFTNLFPAGAPADVLAVKSVPPVLVYTSTPFRGLDILLDVFPAIRQACSDVRLQIYSSMQVYQMTPDKDRAKYGQLYDRCRSTPGVEYIGSVSQPELAQALRSASLLAYPNHFAETSCISVMEALAAGCHVVTTELGALPETTAGFADLIGCQLSPEEYRRQFVERTVEAIDEFRNRPEIAAGHLQRQVEFVRDFCNWPVRAREWSEWLARSQ